MRPAWAFQGIRDRTGSTSRQTAFYPDPGQSFQTLPGDRCDASNLGAAHRAARSLFPLYFPDPDDSKAPFGLVRRQRSHSHPVQKITAFYRASHTQRLILTFHISLLQRVPKGGAFLVTDYDPKFEPWRRGSCCELPCSCLSSVRITPRNSARPLNLPT